MTGRRLILAWAQLLKDLILREPAHPSSRGAVANGANSSAASRRMRPPLPATHPSRRAKRRAPQDDAPSTYISPRHPEARAKRASKDDGLSTSPLIPSGTGRIVPCHHWRPKNWSRRRPAQSRLAYVPRPIIGPDGGPNTWLVVSLEPIPDVFCEPPKPAAHTLQRGSSTYYRIGLWNRHSPTYQAIVVPIFDLAIGNVFRHSYSSFNRAVGSRGQVWTRFASTI
jgi:hypothetical protein